jgi:hypothetical protein
MYVQCRLHAKRIKIQKVNHTHTEYRFLISIYSLVILGPRAERGLSPLWPSAETQTRDGETRLRGGKVGTTDTERGTGAVLPSLSRPLAACSPRPPADRGGGGRQDSHRPHARRRSTVTQAQHRTATWRGPRPERHRPRQTRAPCRGRPWPRTGPCSTSRGRPRC